MEKRPLTWLFLLLSLAILSAGLVFFLNPNPENNTQSEKIPIATKTETHETPAITETNSERLPAPATTPTSELRAPVAKTQMRIGEGAVIGRIVEVDGKIVPDFPIEVYGSDARMPLPSMQNWFDEKSFDVDFCAAKTKTDSEGKFKILGLKSRAFYMLGLGIGGNRPQMRFLDHVPNAGETVDLGDIPLEAYAIFTGRVLDFTGEPVAGARIRASNLPGFAFSMGLAEMRTDGVFCLNRQGEKQVFTAPNWIKPLIDKFPLPSTRSDAQGRFRLEGVPLGQAILLVDTKDRPTLQHGPTPTGKGGEKDLGDLRLEEGEELEGIVLGSDGKPIAGAEIFAGAKLVFGDGALLRPAGKSDEKGHFTAKGFRSVSSYAAARLDSISPWGVSELFSPGGEEVTIQIPTGFDLQVFFKAFDGKAIANPELVLKSSIAVKEFPLWSPPISLSGRLNRETDGSLRIKRLPPGEYLVLARAPGYAMSTQNVEVKEESLSIEISLAQSMSSKIRVVEKYKQIPIEGATVIVRPAESRQWTVPITESTTNSNGECIVEGLGPGSYFFEASHPFFGSSAIPANMPNESLNIELDAAGAIEGRIHVAGQKPESPRMIFLEARGERTGFVFPRFSSTDLDGRYRVENLDPGEYRIQVQAASLTASSFDWFQQMQQGPQKRVKTQIEAGKTTTLDIDLSNDAVEGPSGRLTGRVTLNGRAGANLTASVWREGRKVVTTDASGYFDLGQLKAGSNWITISLPTTDGQYEPSQLGSRSVEVKAGETVDTEWSFTTGIVKGRVLKSSDRSAGAFFVVSASVQSGEQKNSNHGWLRANADQYGDFVFDPAPAGKWSVFVQQAGFATPNVQFELAEGEQKTSVEVLLESSVPCHGKLELPSNVSKIQGLWLNFYPKGVSNTRRRGSGWARVNPETLEFACDTLGPGEYQVDLNAWGASENAPQFASQTIEIPPQGLESAVLRFALKSQDPPTTK